MAPGLLGEQQGASDLDGALALGFRGTVPRIHLRGTVTWNKQGRNPTANYVSKIALGVAIFPLSCKHILGWGPQPPGHRPLGLLVLGLGARTPCWLLASNRSWRQEAEGLLAPGIQPGGVCPGTWPGLGRKGKSRDGEL